MSCKARYAVVKYIQGDVVGVYNSAGTKVVGFTYDAYGNCTVSGDTSLAQWCKIRYRGYYFDTETGLYWVQTRYYNPEWCRWISPDSLSYLDPETAHGLNLYAYCINDPVNYIDPSGHFIITLIGCIVGAAIGFGVAAYKDYKDDGEAFNGSVEWYDYLGATLLGGAIGGAAGYVASSLIPAASSFASTTFTIGGGISASAGGAAAATAGITITGAEIMVAGGVLAGASVLGGILMFARTPRSGGYYGERWPGDHKPDHVHLKGNGINVRIGRDGKPLPGERPLSRQAKNALERLWQEFLKLFSRW